MASVYPDASPKPLERKTPSSKLRSGCSGRPTPENLPPQRLPADGKREASGLEEFGVEYRGPE